MKQTFLHNSFLCSVLFLLLQPVTYAQDTQQIINQTILAHGGSALSQVNSSVSTGLLTDYRMNPSLPLSATFKSLGKATRTEYTDAQGPVALVRNGTKLWEVRTTRAKEYPKQHFSFQDVVFNPSLGLLGGLSVPEFSYVTTTTFRGRSVYVLRKSYWTEPSGSSNFNGTQESVYAYVDVGTYLIMQVDYTFGSGYHYWSFHFDNYNLISGVAVPMTVSHWLDSTLVWQFQAQTVAFNANLSPRDFISP